MLLNSLNNLQKSEIEKDRLIEYNFSNIMF